MVSLLCAQLYQLDKCVVKIIILGKVFKTLLNKLKKQAKDSIYHLNLRITCDHFRKKCSYFHEKVCNLLKLTQLQPS